MTLATLPYSALRSAYYHAVDAGFPQRTCAYLGALLNAARATRPQLPTTTAKERGQHG